MLYVGLDLSRKRLDWEALREDGEVVARGADPPDADGLRHLTGRLSLPVLAAIESMGGARFVHDQLELEGWDVRVADAVKVKGLAPLACKTDRIDAHVLAELARLDLIPEVWLPDPTVRGERELVRFRLHLVHHRTSLKNRVHAALTQHGLARPAEHLFTDKWRDWLADAAIPEPWRQTMQASLELIDELDRQIDALERELHARHLEHAYVPLLTTCPGIRVILGYTIAVEIGAIERFPSPRKLTGYTGLCPRVYQSGDSDYRGALTKHGPRYLRWAFIEAAHNAGRHPLYQPLVERTRARLGPKRGRKIANLEIARRLAEATWYMLTRNQPFAPAGAGSILAARRPVV
jgi:transposase